MLGVKNDLDFCAHQREQIRPSVRRQPPIHLRYTKINIFNVFYDHLVFGNDESEHSILRVPHQKIGVPYIVIKIKVHILLAIYAGVAVFETAELFKKQSSPFQNCFAYSDYKITTHCLFFAD